MSDTSQVASMGGGGWDNKLPISLHYLALGEGQGGGLRSLPLHKSELNATQVLDENLPNMPGREWPVDAGSGTGATNRKWMKK